MEGQQPLLKWEKPSSSIVSYKLAVQTNEGMLDLLESPQTSLSYTTRAIRLAIGYIESRRLITTR